MSNIDKIMALADAYATCDFSPQTRGTHRQCKEALRAAIAEALDMGEPVCWVDAGGYHSNVKTELCHTPLYAAKDAAMASEDIEDEAQFTGADFERRTDVAAALYAAKDAK